LRNNDYFKSNLKPRKMAKKAKKEENHLQVLVDKLKDPKHKQLVQTNRLKKKRRNNAKN